MSERRFKPQARPEVGIFYNRVKPPLAVFIRVPFALFAFTRDSAMIPRPGSKAHIKKVRVRNTVVCTSTP